jgi:Fic family protein
VMTMFVVADVHPFVDGNGRAARLAMNDELTAGGQHRIIIPTALRDDYLAGLRRLTRNDDPEVYIKTLRFAHDYTAAVNWSTFGDAEADLTESFAFENEPEMERRLRIPNR